MVIVSAICVCRTNSPDRICDGFPHLILRTENIGRQSTHRPYGDFGRAIFTLILAVFPAKYTCAVSSFPSIMHLSRHDGIGGIAKNQAIVSFVLFYCLGIGGILRRRILCCPLVKTKKCSVHRKRYGAVLSACVLGISGGMFDVCVCLIDPKFSQTRKTQ